MSTTPITRDPADGRGRVLLVDDNTVYRTIVRRILTATDDLAVAASVGNGRRAIEYVRDNPVDVVVLDIEMPIMDGLTALPEILAAAPGVPVIMASTLTQRNADISLRALSMGAADYVTKPTTLDSRDPTATFGEELLTKIRALHTARQQRRTSSLARRESRLGATRPGTTQPGTTQTGTTQTGLTQTGTTPASKSVAAPVAGSSGTAPRQVAAAVAVARPQVAATSAKAAGQGGEAYPLRPTPSQWVGRTPKIVAIGSSTGGPRALIDVFTALNGQLTAPVVITQHMPPTFTKILAQHLERCSKMRAVEATEGMPVEDGCIYVAPGAHHLTVRREGSAHVVHIDDGPPENFCKPSVNPMFRSVAKAYGDWALAVVLTGMGQDGATGLTDIVGAGGLAIAQDEESSVVWGMPRAAAATGLCSAILPLVDIPRYLRDHAMRHAA